MTLVAAKPALLGVSEIFGPTVQGEGPSVGRRCAFLRLTGCNLSCAWCDTAYTWDWKRHAPEAQIQALAPDDVLGQLLRIDAGLVVVTGGEPLLQEDRLVPVITRLKMAGRRVEIETNGTHTAPDLLPWVDRFNVSPKLEHSRAGARHKRFRPDTLAWFVRSGKAIFKFVAASVADLGEIAELAQIAAIPDDLIWVMPEGTNALALGYRLRDLADPVIARGWNLTPRLHTLIWGDERGR